MSFGNCRKKTFPRPHISKFSEGAYLQTLQVWSAFGAQYVLHVRTLSNSYAAPLVIKAIATRLEKILAQIIHPCQAGYIKGSGRMRGVLGVLIPRALLTNGTWYFVVTIRV